METRRLQLNEELLAICPRVYFQPPADQHMNYPCVVYNRAEYDTERADDRIYQGKQAYDVQVIYYDPDDPTPYEILYSFEYARWGTSFVHDSLYHQSLTIFY